MTKSIEELKAERDKAIEKYSKSLSEVRIAGIMFNEARIRSNELGMYVDKSSMALGKALELAATDIEKLGEE